MVKTFRLLLIAALSVVCGNLFAQEEAKTVLWEASSGDALTTIYPDANISLKWEEGGGDQPAKYSNDNVLFYNGNRLTVAGKTTDVKIQKIVFTFGKGSASLVLCDKSGKNESSTGIANNYSGMTTTWTGEANSLIFRAAKQTNNRYIKSIEVTYTGGTSGPVVTAPELAITQDGIADTYDMDANGVFVVYYENKGTAAAENAKLTLYVDGVENASETIGTLAIGKSDFWNAKYDVSSIEAGSHTVKLSLTADDVEAVNVEKTVTFTKKAPEATFTVTAQNVEVAYDATSYNVVATVKNTSETVDATGVQVLLQRNIQDVADPQTIESLAAGAETQVTFTVTAPEGGFAAGSTNMWVMVKAYEKTMAQQELTVTVAEAPVVETKSLTISGVDGTIKLGEESNTLRVIVQNTGNVDITDAPVVLKSGDTTLGQGTVSAKAGQQGWTTIAVDKTGLEAGTITVKAIVTVDETPVEQTAEITVEAAPVAQATFSIVAPAVTVAADAESFNIVATVKNTSDVDATNVAVNLLEQTTIDTKTIETLAAGEEAQVTFTVAGGPFTFTQKEYQIWIGNGTQGSTRVAVTVEQAVEEVVDINLIDIRGLENINLKNETNAVQVWFSNQSNIDVENATIKLTMNSTEVGTETIAKNTQYVQFTLPTEGLEAGQEVTLVATLSVENNKEGNTAEVTKTLQVVSGEAAPAAVITLNPVANQEFEAAGEQTINVNVGVFNNGNADAENVELVVYKEYSSPLATKTVSIKAGESAIVTLSFDYDVEKTEELHVAAKLNSVVADYKDFTIGVKAEVADLTIAKIADIEATTDDEVKVTVTVKNRSGVKAENVLVALYQGTTQVDTQKNITEIEGGAEAQVEFTIGKLANGNYSFNVQITSTDADADNNAQTFAVKVSEPVVEKVEVALTQIQGSQIDLAAETNTATVWVENLGTQAAEATIGLKLNDTELQAQTVSVLAGKNGFAQFTLPTEGLVAGEKATLVASVSVEGNESSATTLTKELDIINSTVATEPVFEATAADVNVELPAEKFSVEVNVKNVTAIDATDVKVQLFYNQTVAEQTVATLNGNAETTVTFADVENTFTKADTYTMSVMVNGKAVGSVNIVVKEAEVEPVYNLAVTEIIGSLDKNVESSSLSVAVENKGNQDMKDVEVKLAIGENNYNATITFLKAAETGYAFFQVPTEGLTAGEINVTASVEVEGDADTEDNTKTVVVNVKDVDAALPTFTVSAENVEVAFGAQSFNIVATVKNTSEVDAANVEVKLMQSVNVVETKTIETLAAGAEAEVTFTVNAEEENPFVAGKTVTYFVQAAAQAQAAVEVAFEAEPVAPVYDLTVTSISGPLSMDVETNYLTVFVENKGNVDIDGEAKVSLLYNSTADEKSVTLKAGASGMYTFEVPATALTVGEFTVTAQVAFGEESIVDATPDDNTMSKTYTIAAPAAELSFQVVDVVAKQNAETFDVKVVVSNSEKAAAQNVAVAVYDNQSVKLGEATIENLAAGAKETVTITIEKTYSETGIKKNELQVLVSGVEGAKWVDVNVMDEGTYNGINSLKAQFGENVRVFDVNGRKVNEVRKGGLYIVNGTKIVVR